MPLIFLWLILATLLVLVVAVSAASLAVRKRRILVGWKQIEPAALVFLTELDEQLELRREEEASLEQAETALLVVRQLPSLAAITASPVEFGAAMAVIIAHHETQVDREKKRLGRRLGKLQEIYSRAGSLVEKILDLTNQLNSLSSRDCDDFPPGVVDRIINGSFSIGFVEELIKDHLQAFDHQDFLEPRLCGSECYHTFCRPDHFQRGQSLVKTDGKCQLHECSNPTRSSGAAVCNKCSVLEDQCAVCQKQTVMHRAFKTGMFGPWLHNRCQSEAAAGFDCTSCGGETSSADYCVCRLCSAKQTVCQRCGQPWLSEGGLAPEGANA